MKKIQLRALTLLVLITFAASTLAYYTPRAFAATVTAHVRIVGSSRTIWYGDVTTDGCTVTDTANAIHTYTTPMAVCALDAAAKTGGFAYTVQDFGGSLGLFLKSIATDAGASDFSTYWSYDVNGTAASSGISSYTVNPGDILYFHFVDPKANPTNRSLNDGLTYLRSQQQSNGQMQGFSGITEWATMAFAAAGVDPNTVKTNNTSLVDYLTNNPPTTQSSATDWERAILAITAAGKNPSSFNGINYLSQLENYHTGGQLGQATQVNDDAFGLLALTAAGNTASTTTKQDVLNFILSHQQTDGGFSWSTTQASDVDDTAAVLQALTAAQNTGMPVATTAIDNAKTYLLSAQNTDGGFPYTKGDTSNSSSTAWADMALHALGLTGTPDDKAQTYLIGNQEENGSFKWQPTATGEAFTTSYAVIALAGKSWPVKVFSGTTPTPTVTPTGTPTPTAKPTATPTLQPTSTPKPTVTVVPTVTQQPSPTPTKPHDGKHRREKIEEHQRQLVQKLKAQIQKELDRLMQLINALGKHR